MLSATTTDPALTSPFARRAYEGSQPCQGRNRLALEVAQFGQQQQQAERGALADPVDALDQLQPGQQVGFGGDALHQQDPLGRLAPLQPLDLPAQGSTHMRQVRGLQARLGPHHVLLQLLDQPQMLGQRSQPRIGSPVHPVEQRRAGGNQRRIQRIALGPLQAVLRERPDLQGLQHRHLEAGLAQRASHFLRVGTGRFQSDPHHLRRAEPLDQLTVAGCTVVEHHAGRHAMQRHVQPCLADVDPGYDHVNITHLRPSCLVFEPGVRATIRIG